MRVDEYDELTDELAVRLRAVGIRSAVGAPIVVAGRLWGAVIAASGRPYGLPADAEERIAGFAQLITDALANADAREQLASSRAASCRPATRSGGGSAATSTTAPSRSSSTS